MLVSYRYDEEKKELQLEKSKLMKQNEAKKLQLEDLENKVDRFIAVSLLVAPLREER